MQCPICNFDLSPLDLVSRTEHVDLCIENGPSTLEIGESGRLVVKKTVAPGKQRKICPICDKTFQALNSHFKTCSMKNDVPPSLMLEYWDKIQSDSTKPKKFPRELLDNFVTKCIKEGRIGDQVDFARALSLSMAEGEPQTSDNGSTTTTVLSDPSPAMGQQADQDASSGPSAARNVDQILMQNATSRTTAVRPGKQAKKFRLELVDESTKEANVALRIDRELAATRSRRYHEALDQQQQQEDDCVIFIESPVDVGGVDNNNDDDERELNKLFYKARMKACTGSEPCLQGSCKDHELVLLMEEFQIYSGASMDAPPKKYNPQTLASEQQTSENEGGETVVVVDNDEKPKVY